MNRTMARRIALLLAPAFTALVVEIWGIVQKNGPVVDTYSQLYWRVRDGSTPSLQVMLAVFLAAFLSWLWWHFTFEGR